MGAYWYLLDKDYKEAIFIGKKGEYTSPKRAHLIADFVQRGSGEYDLMSDRTDEVYEYIEGDDWTLLELFKCPECGEKNIGEEGAKTDCMYCNALFTAEEEA